eukprot:PhM_4_TR18690/c0_g5_i6/m.98809
MHSYFPTRVRPDDIALLIVLQLLTLQVPGAIAAALNLDSIPAIMSGSVVRSGLYNNDLTLLISATNVPASFRTKDPIAVPADGNWTLDFDVTILPPNPTTPSQFVFWISTHAEPCETASPCLGDEMYVVQGRNSEAAPFTTQTPAGWFLGFAGDTSRSGQISFTRHSYVWDNDPDEVFNTRVHYRVQFDQSEERMSVFRSSSTSIVRTLSEVLKGFSAARNVYLQFAQYGWWVNHTAFVEEIALTKGSFDSTPAPPTTPAPPVTIPPSFLDALDEMWTPLPPDNSSISNASSSLYLNYVAAASDQFDGTNARVFTFPSVMPVASLINQPSVNEDTQPVIQLQFDTFVGRSPEREYTVVVKLVDENDVETNLVYLTRTRVAPRLTGVVLHGTEAPGNRIIPDDPAARSSSEEANSTATTAVNDITLLLVRFYVHLELGRVTVTRWYPLRPDLQRKTEVLIMPNNIAGRILVSKIQQRLSLELRSKHLGNDGDAFMRHVYARQHHVKASNLLQRLTSTRPDTTVDFRPGELQTFVNTFAVPESDDPIPTTKSNENVHNVQQQVLELVHRRGIDTNSVRMSSWTDWSKSKAPQADVVRVWLLADHGPINTAKINSTVLTFDMFHEARLLNAPNTLTSYVTLHIYGYCDQVVYGSASLIQGVGQRNAPLGAEGLGGTNCMLVSGASENGNSQIPPYDDNGDDGEEDHALFNTWLTYVVTVSPDDVVHVVVRPRGDNNTVLVERRLALVDRSGAWSKATLCPSQSSTQQLAFKWDHFAYSASYAVHITNATLQQNVPSAQQQQQPQPLRSMWRTSSAYEGIEMDPHVPTFLSLSRSERTASSYAFGAVAELPELQGDALTHVANFDTPPPTLRYRKIRIAFQHYAPRQNMSFFSDYPSSMISFSLMPKPSQSRVSLDVVDSAENGLPWVSHGYNSKFSGDLTGGVYVYSTYNKDHPMCLLGGETQLLDLTVFSDLIVVDRNMVDPKTGQVVDLGQRSRLSLTYYPRFSSKRMVLQAFLLGDGTASVIVSNVTVEDVVEYDTDRGEGYEILKNVDVQHFLEMPSSELNKNTLVATKGLVQTVDRHISMYRAVAEGVHGPYYSGDGYIVWYVVFGLMPFVLVALHTAMLWCLPRHRPFVPIQVEMRSVITPAHADTRVNALADKPTVPLPIAGTTLAPTLNFEPNFRPESDGRTALQALAWALPGMHHVDSFVARCAMLGEEFGTRDVDLPLSPRRHQFDVFTVDELTALAGLLDEDALEENTSKKIDGTMPDETLEKRHTFASCLFLAIARHHMEAYSDVKDILPTYLYYVDRALDRLPSFSGTAYLTYSTTRWVREAPLMAVDRVVSWGGFVALSTEQPDEHRERGHRVRLSNAVENTRAVTVVAVHVFDAIAIGNVFGRMYPNVVVTRPGVTFRVTEFHHKMLTNHFFLEMVQRT